MELIDHIIPLLALSLTLAVQSVLAIFWAARLEASVRSFEKRIQKLEENEERAAVEGRRIAEALARFEERLVAQTLVLKEIKEELNK